MFSAFDFSLLAFDRNSLHYKEDHIICYIIFYQIQTVQFKLHTRIIHKNPFLLGLISRNYCFNEGLGFGIPSILPYMFTYDPRHEKTCFLHKQNKVATQTLQLIGAFVFTT